MTVNELIAQLEEARDAGFGDTKVLGAHQPNYPLQESVLKVSWPDPVHWYRDTQVSPLDVSSDDKCDCCGQTATKVFINDTKQDHTLRCSDDDCHPRNDEESTDKQFVHVVLNGTPRNINPYASKDLWG
jgi:hypothetical protein